MTPEGESLRRGAFGSVAKIASPVLLGQPPAEQAFMEQAGARLRATLKTAELDVVWNADVQSAFLCGVSTALENLLAHFATEPHETVEEAVSCLQRSCGLIATDALIASGARWTSGTREGAAATVARWRQELEAERDLERRLSGDEAAS